MDEKEIYKIERMCSACGKTSKMALPVGYVCRNLEKPLALVIGGYENLCFECLNKFLSTHNTGSSSEE